jgi:hypothetical protein
VPAGPVVTERATCKKQTLYMLSYAPTQLLGVDLCKSYTSTDRGFSGLDPSTSASGANVHRARRCTTACRLCLSGWHVSVDAKIDCRQGRSFTRMLTRSCMFQGLTVRLVSSCCPRRQARSLSVACRLSACKSRGSKQGLRVSESHACSL